MNLQTEQQPSIGRIVWLYIFLCSLTNFFQIYPLGLLQEVGRGFPFLIFQIAWLLYGIERYREYEEYNIKDSHINFVLLLYVLIIPSIYMADLLFNQSFLQSLISYRNFLLYLSLPTLFIMEIKAEELIEALYYFSITAFFAAIFQNFIAPDIFVFSSKDYDALTGHYNADYDIFSKKLAGIRLITIPICYYAYKIKCGINRNSLIRLIILFLILFMGQNRSTIFSCTIIIVYCIVLSKSKDKFIKFTLIGLISIISIYYLKDIFLSLIEETNSQINSSYDPRVVAMNYFLDFSRMDILQILFGTGIISFNTSDYVLKLQQAHIHYSDVGFVGFWSQFGIAPTLLLAYELIKGVISRNSELFVKFIGITMLICSVTISYFEEVTSIIWFVCFYYFWKAPLEEDNDNDEYEFV